MALININFPGSATINTGDLTLSGEVSLVPGTTVALASGTSVEVSNSPTVSLAAGSSVEVSNSPTVNIGSGGLTQGAQITAFNAVSMGTDQTSAPTDILNHNRISVTFDWTEASAPSGTIHIDVGDDTNFMESIYNAQLTITLDGILVVDLEEVSQRYIRLRYVRSAGGISDTLNAKITAKA